MNQPIVMSHCQNRHILYHESYVVQRVIVLFVQGNEILQENAGLKRDKAALMAELAAMRTKVATLETKVRFRIPVKYDFYLYKLQLHLVFHAFEDLLCGGVTLLVVSDVVGHAEFIN